MRSTYVCRYVCHFSTTEDVEDEAEDVGHQMRSRADGKHDVLMK